MKIKDAAGNEHDVDPADVLGIASTGHPFRTVEVNGVPEQAPMATVYLRNGDTILVEGTAGAVSAIIHGRRATT